VIHGVQIECVNAHGAPTGRSVRLRRSPTPLSARTPRSALRRIADPSPSFA
jgi:hypothetical protein